MKFSITIKRAVKRWVLRTPQPCRQMAALMSESMDRRLSLAEHVRLRLHLLVCAWCARYLKQIQFLRSIARGKISAEPDNATFVLPLEARERISNLLNQSGGSD